MVFSSDHKGSKKKLINYQNSDVIKIPLSAHDKKLKEIVKKRKKNPKNIVKADLKGEKKPKPIGKDKRIPDATVQDKKTGRTKEIIEVETPRSKKTDKKQQESFKKSAARQRAKYTEVIVKKPKTTTKKPKTTKNSTKRKKKQRFSGKIGRESLTEPNEIVIPDL